MKSHPGVRKTIKWTGAAAALLLTGAWLQSGWRMNTWTSGGRNVMLWHGGVTAVYAGDPPHPPWVWTSMGTTNDPVALLGGRPSCRKYSGQWIAEMPVWPLPLVLALITGAVWRQDALARRRERRGLCPKCNYDRTGLAADAVCPECGRAV